MFHVSSRVMIFSGRLFDFVKDFRANALAGIFFFWNEPFGSHFRGKVSHVYGVTPNWP